MLNIYCDESGHLENDDQEVMSIGGIASPGYAVNEIYDDIRKIKKKHNIPSHREIKWNKVSEGELQYYEEIVEYFFSNELLRFRCVIMPDKKKLKHKEYNQTHDDFYYKMYYYTIHHFLNNEDDIEVYIDIKDTNSNQKIKRLFEVLDNSSYRYQRSVSKIQQIRSHENSILQIADLLIGAVTYTNRGFESSEAKLHICEMIKRRSGQLLTKTSSFSQNKFNLLVLDRL